MNAFQTDFSLIMQAITAVAVAVAAVFGFLNNRLGQANKATLGDVHAAVNSTASATKNDIRNLTATISGIAQSKGN